MGRRSKTSFWIGLGRGLQLFVKDITATHGKDLQPSFFETLLLMCLRLCHEIDVGTLVLEVAIGGYNDVVSLFQSPISVITAVGSDHRDELGPTIAAIAADKAGIASSGSTLVLGPRLPDEATAAIAEDTRRRGVRLVTADNSRINC